MTDRRQAWVWMLLTTVGLAGGIAAALALGGPVQRVVGMMLVTPILTCLVGAVLGAAQAVQRRGVRWQWGVATTVGTGIGLAAGVVVVEQGGRFLTGQALRVAGLAPLLRAASFLVVGGVAGLVLGVAQWLVVRRETPRVKNWVTATTAGLAVAFAASSVVVDGLLGGMSSPAGGLAFVLLASVVFGALTSRPWRDAQ